MKSCLLLGVISVIATLSANSAVGQQSYTPEQAISTVYSSMRNTLGFGDTANSSVWLSLSTVGSFVDANDVSQINDLANFCPEPLPVIQSYSRARKMDQIYENVLNGLTGPVRDHSAEYTLARAFLRNAEGNGSSDEYEQYGAYESQYNSTFSEYLRSTDDSERRDKLNEIQAIERDWLLFGYRAEVDEALDVINSENALFGAILQGQRRRVLNAYRAGGLAPSDVPGAFKSPASEISPPVDRWPGSAWTEFSFDHTIVDRDYNATSSSEQGFGGLSLGFVTVGVSSGGGNSTVSDVTTISQFSYSYELARVQIRRPWLDARVFFEPTAWTWKDNTSTSEFPLVANSTTPQGRPVASAVNLYDNFRVDCPLLPLELIIARNRTLTATVSKESYSRITTSGSSGGGGGLFGIFGGKKKRWSTTKIDETDDTVTFSINAPEIAVIGVISEILPLLPEPNRADNWPDDAWLPE